MPATHRSFTLSLISKQYAICRFAPDATVPDWALRGQFASATRTRDELSIIAEVDLIPPQSLPKSSWRILKVHGPFASSEVGVLASLVVPLEQSNISVFTVSTFDTDYLLVNSETIGKAIAALRSAGHTISNSESI